MGLIGLLVLLEGALSIDNALVLGLLAKRLPKHQQQQALTYGLVGAFAFRFIAVFMAAQLLEWHVVKLLGGGYLAYIAIKHLFFERHDEGSELTLSATGEPTVVHAVSHAELTPEEEVEELAYRAPLPLPEQAERYAIEAVTAKFWPTVLVIELTDIAFAVDSILAAIGVVGSKPEKLWVIVVGGLLGVVLMRFAAVIFIRLLERFPRFSSSAYVLVLIIGGKLLVDYWLNTAEHPHRVDFHSVISPAFWAFWGLMLLAFLAGFLPKRHASPQPA